MRPSAFGAAGALRHNHAPGCRRPTALPMPTRRGSRSFRRRDRDDRVDPARVLRALAAGAREPEARRTLRLPAPVIVPNRNLVVQRHPADPRERRPRRRALQRLSRPPLRRLASDAARDAGLVPRRPAPSTTQIFRLASPLAEPEPLTDSAEPVRRCQLRADRRRATSSSSAAAAATRRRSSTGSTSPRTGRRRSPSPTSATTCRPGCTGRAQLLYLSLPLDRTAARRPTRGHPPAPDPRRSARTPSSAAGSPSCRAAAGTSAACPGTTGRSRSPATSRPRVAGLAARPRERRDAPGAAGGRAGRRPTHLGAGLEDATTRASSSLSDRSGEFRELMFYRLADGRLARDQPHHPLGHREREPRRERPPARRARQRRGPRRAALLRRRHLRRAAESARRRRQRRAGATSIRACRCWRSPSIGSTEPEPRSA